jgi:hypothetical protein
VAFFVFPHKLINKFRKAGDFVHEANYSSKHHKCKVDKKVSIPVELYKSLRGEYFIGYADDITFGKGRNGWARLYNPYNSGVNLHVNVWTVSDVSDSPFRAQFWFNADPPGIAVFSPLVTCSNTTITPNPKPKVKLQLSSDVDGEPSGGIKAFVRRGMPGTTLVDTENGKLIFPPGGSFMIFLSNTENPDKRISGRVAFGWWEEKVSFKSIK